MNGITDYLGARMCWGSASSARRCLAAVLAGCLVLALFAGQASGSLILELGYSATFSDDSVPPAQDPPWLRATFAEDSGGAVLLTLEAVGLTIPEYVQAWYFNFDPTLDVEALTISYLSGVQPSDIKQQENAFNADGDGYFDILFDFPNANNGRFGANDVSVFRITPSTNAGYSISPWSFAFESQDGNHDPNYQRDWGPYVSAAKIGGTGEDGEDSAWVHAHIIPEPASLVIWSLMGAGGLALAWRRRRKAGG